MSMISGEKLALFCAANICFKTHQNEKTALHFITALAVLSYHGPSTSGHQLPSGGKRCQWQSTIQPSGFRKDDHS